MLGRWDYGPHAPVPKYGTAESYRAACEWLDALCETVEDWGCGTAAAKPYFKRAKYIGVDGSPGYADVIDDLRGRRSVADGILLRHVLEHNYDWPLVVVNAARSCRWLAIVFFLEPRRFTEVSSVSEGGIPNLHVSETLLCRVLDGEGFIGRSVTIPRDDGSPHKHEWVQFWENPVAIKPASRIGGRA